MFQWYHDKDFWQTLCRLAAPIMLQQFIMSALNAVDVFMIGQLNETAVAALGLADQLFFLLNMFLFGLTSGAAIFSAQYWGNRNIEKIQNLLGITLSIAMLLSGIFFLAGAFWPEFLFGLYTTDAEVIAVGSSYLSIVAWSYIATGITFTYASILRSMEVVKLPTVVNVMALILNVIFNYLLIFGHWGFPKLGVEGAAIATCIARCLECTVLLGWIYYHKHPVAVSWRVALRWDRALLPSFVAIVFPVLINEIFWSLGITVYHMIYARISTESIAAISILSSFDRLMFVGFISLAGASAIMLGNRIGAKEYDLVKLYSRYFMHIVVMLAILVGALIFVASDWIPSLYEISETAQDYLSILLKLAATALVIKGLNCLLMVGILRSGGDTRFSLVADLFCIWCIGVPAAYIGAFIWEFPIYWVYALVILEEIAKVIICIWRLVSQRWIHQLAHETA